MPLVTDLDNLGYYLLAGATPPADYVTGTVTTTLNNAAVVGSGTTFTAAMVGRTIKIGAAAATTANTYVITGFTDGTHITIAASVDGVSAPTIAALSTQAIVISANVTIDTTAKTIALRAGNLVDTGGVTLKALYSKLKSIWKNDANAIKFSFPMVPITDEAMEIGNTTDAWKPADDTTRQLLRTGGWAEKAAGLTTREYAGIVTLGSLQGSEQVYFTQVNSNVAPTKDFVLAGAVNQAIQTFGDGSNGSFDYRGYCKLFVRTQGRTYASAGLTDIGVTTMTYQVYRFPLASAVDANIATADGTIATWISGGLVKLTYFGVDQTRTIGAGSPNFRIIITGDSSKTKTQLNEAVQYLLRQSKTFIGTDGVGVGTTTFTSAAGTFAAGDVGSYIAIQGAGTYRITAQASATSVTLDGSVPSGTGYAYSGGASVDTVSQVNHDGVANGSTTFTSVAGSFVAGMVGKSITITGKGTYTISAVGSGTSITLSGSPSAGTTLEYVIGSPFGVINSPLVTYIGGTLTTLQDGSSGTFIDNYLTSDINSIFFTDNTGTLRNFPYTASLVLNFGSNLVSDASAIYRVFFTTNPTGNFGSATAVLVVDASAVPMSGNVSGGSAVTLSFPYDTSVTGGRTAGTDADITAVAIGLDTGQYVSATGTIGRNTSNSVSLVAALERNYSAA